MRKRQFIILGSLLMITIFSVKAQITVDVNVNMEHSVEGVSELDRSKFFTIHSDIDDQEWWDKGGDNFTDDVMDHFLTGYDVYMGRATGGVSWQLGNMHEDDSRPGFVDLDRLKSLATTSRNSYNSNTKVHKYESRNLNQILCTQQRPFYPDGERTIGGSTWNPTAWYFSDTDTEEEPLGTASGEYYANYIKEYYGDNGKPRPTIIELVNEPLWELVKYGDQTHEQVYKFHNTVASEVRKINDDVKIGGYVAAFPDFEKNDFQDWENIDKKFMDMCGENMDFWSIHLYDFSSISGGQKKLRSGSNVEATFDMMEQYSLLSLDTIKPFVVSEYGGRAHDLEKDPWSSYRDWMCIKGTNSLLMSFLERPDKILSTLPFIMLKTTWSHVEVFPAESHEHRLLRMEGEPTSATGKWVYSDMVMFYQLWADVKGTRIDSKSTHADFQVDAYVDGKKAYVIVNSLLFTDETIKLNLIEDEGNTLEKISVKSYYEKDKQSVLDTTEYASVDDEITVGAEGTIVIEYTYTNDIAVDQSSDEAKYYADTYYKEIVAGTTETFNISGVSLGDKGEAVLRLGIGRSHSKSKQPLLKVNDTEVVVPSNYRGYNQAQRDSYYGVIEIPVPYALLKESNKIEVTFDDDGGHIASVAMQVFDFSKEITRSTVAVTGLEVSPTNFSLKVGNTRLVKSTITPVHASDQKINWVSDKPEIATVSPLGMVTAVSPGVAVITATTNDGDFDGTVTVTVPETNVVSILNSENVIISPNPVQDVLNIDLPGNSDQVQVSVLSVDGRMVKELIFAHSNTVLDFTNIPAGVYILKVENNSSRFTQRIIKR